MLKLAVFEEGEVYGVEARMRFRLEGGRPAFGFLLVEPERVQRDAFAAVRTAVIEQTGLPLFVGSPE